MERPLVIAVAMALFASPTTAQQPTYEQQVELQEFSEAYLLCGRLNGREIAISEPDLERENVVRVAAARCQSYRDALDAKAVEIEGSDMAAMMRSFDTTNFSVSVESAVDGARREAGLPLK
ncbi:hypothetical protein [Devosia lacusdianchii]|uniref:hypothetical protein n=1 Tax=Devosia lacusdianchii TaxID=2917991 RepID=UPI001F06AABE|nr:hypothetical protein [Devosia sp. JXJ CY 41]